MEARPTHEVLVGLHVTDEAGYQRYREGMTPLLAARGGRFRYDFRVAEVLHGETQAPINRVFVLAFPERAAKTAFFADPAYRAVRARHFAGAVDAVTEIAVYDRPGSADPA